MAKKKQFKKPEKKAWIRDTGFKTNKNVDAFIKSNGGNEWETAGFKQWMDYRQARYDQDSQAANKSYGNWQQSHAKSLEKQEKKKQEYSLKDSISKSEADRKKRREKSLLPAVKGKKSKGVWDDLKAAGTLASEFFNPFDKVDAEEAVNKYLNRDRSDTMKAIERGSNRAVDSASLSVMSNLDKKDIKLPGKVGDYIGKEGREPYYNSERKWGEGGGTDMLTTGIGYLVPGVGAVKGVRAAGLGAKAGVEGFPKLLQLAKEGAAVGTALSSAEVGVREALNGDDYNWKDNAKHIGMGFGTGLVGDPLLHGAGKAVGTAVKKPLELGANKTMGKMFSSDVTAKRLADALKIADSENIREFPNLSNRQTARGLQELIPNSSELTKPNLVPQLRPKQGTPITAPEIGKPLVEPKVTNDELVSLFNKGELPLADRAFQLEGKSRELPDLSFGKPKSEPIPQENPVNVYGVETPYDKVEHAPSGFWRKRYEDFVDHVKKNYDTNKLTQEGLDDLWSQYAQYDEPVTLEQLVDLAYPANAEKPVIDANQVWDRLGPKGRVPKQAKEILGIGKKGELTKPLVPKVQPKQVKEVNIPLGLKKFLKNPPPEVATAKEAPVKPAQSIQPVQAKNENPEMVDRFLKAVNEHDAKAAQPVKLRTVKPKKDVNTMAKDELETVMNELVQKRETLKKTKAPKQHVEEVEKDIEEVKGLLMKLDLQLFGKAAEKEAPTPKTPKQQKKPKVTPEEKAAMKEKAIKKKEAREQAKAEVKQLLKYSHTWNDKPKFMLKRETMVRNFEDIMGKDAQKMKFKFLNNIGKSEAESVRFKTAERSGIEKIGIKAYSKDSALAQMYGEGKITLDELKGETKNWEKVVQLTDHLRKKYDEWLPKMNQVLEDNGYDPVPYRKNYFPHMEDLSKWEQFLRDNVGIDFTDNTLPTEINGRTGQFKPGKQFFRNTLQRKGDETAYDAVLGADKYLEGMSNVVHHTPNIKAIRNLANGIREKHGDSKHLSNFAAELDEYANILAGKKAAIDRATEDTFGRKAYNVVDTLRRKTGVNMVGANLGSALTNFIPLTHSLATTEKKAFIKGLTETMANAVNDDGFVNKSDFLTRRMGSEPIAKNLSEKVASGSMVLMRKFDEFTSQLIVRSKYNELISKGMEEERAMRKADEWAAKIMADRSKGSMPTLFSSKTLGLFSQFQLEVNNQLSFLMKDMPKNTPNKAKLAGQYAQVLLYSYLYNNLYEKATGRRPALDPIGIAFQAEKDYNNEKLSTGEASKNLAENTLNQLPFTSVLTGGRIPMGAAIPNYLDAAEGKSTFTKETMKPLTYILPPAGGGQVKKSIEGLTTMNMNPLSKQPTSGAYNNSGNLMYPVKETASNKAKAVLFGKSTLPETDEYYTQKRSALSEGQTEAFQKLYKEGKGQDLYNYLRVANTKPYDKGKVTRIMHDKKLSDAEKLQKLKELLDSVKK